MQQPPAPPSPCRLGTADGELISTLVLAYTFGLPRAAERCRRQLLSDIARLPDQLGASGAKAQALDSLADLPAGIQTAELMLELMLQAGRETASVQRLSARCAAYQAAVAMHVRDFRGASGIRDAINTHVHMNS